jgi:hypothetical protein
MANALEQFTKSFEKVLPGLAKAESPADMAAAIKAIDNKAVVELAMASDDLAASGRPAPTRLAHSIGASTFGSYAAAGVVGLVLVATGIQVGGWVGKGIGYLRGTV